MGHAEEATTVNIYSHAMPWRELRYRSGLNSSSFLEHMAVEYAGQKLFIGEEAYRQSKARVNMSPERFCSIEGMALLLSALAVLAPNPAQVRCVRTDIENGQPGLKLAPYR